MKFHFTILSIFKHSNADILHGLDTIGFTLCSISMKNTFVKVRLISSVLRAKEYQYLSIRLTNQSPSTCVMLGPY